MIGLDNLRAFSIHLRVRASATWLRLHELSGGIGVQVKRDFPRAKFPAYFRKNARQTCSIDERAPKKIMTPLLALLAISATDGRAQDEFGDAGPVIKAVQEDENTIRVIVPGQFETTFRPIC